MFVAVCRLGGVLNVVRSFFRTASFPGIPGATFEATGTTWKTADIGVRSRVARAVRGSSGRPPLAWGLLLLGAGMGTGERATCVLEVRARRFGVESRPRVAGRIHPPGRGPSPVRPDTAHLRESAPRSFRSPGANGCNDALTRIRPMRYGPRLSGARALVGVLTDGGGRRSVRRARHNVEVTEGHSHKVRGGRDPRSRFEMDRSHGEAEGAREGRRARIGLQIGPPRADRRAESLVRRCKGCKGVVSSYGVPRSR